MTDDTSRPASWAALNAPIAFIGLLEIIVGLGDLITPTRIITTYGHFPPEAAVWLAGYVISGIGLIYSVWTGRVRTSAYAAVLMIVMNTFQLIFNIARLGLGASTRSVLISACLAIMMGAWLRALMRGGTIVIPRWHSR